MSIAPSEQLVAQSGVIQDLQHIAKIRETLELFCKGVFEIRCMGPKAQYKKISSGYFDDAKLAATVVYRLEGKFESVGFIANTIDPALFARAPNLMVDGPKATTADADVLRRRWLMVDLDPVRVSGVSSTDEECESAIQRANAAIDFLSEKFHWPEPVLACSGNGAHILFRIDLPADEPCAALLKSVLSGISLGLEAHQPQAPEMPRVEIDPQTSNACRLCKLYGTMPQKGCSTTDRPHRRSEILNIPETIGIVSLEQLQAVAGLAGTGLAVATKPRVARASNEGSRRLMVDQWLRDRGRAFHTKSIADGRTAFLLDECPFNPEHGRANEVCVMQAGDGKLSAKCHHASCITKDWQAFKKAIGAPGPEHFDPPLRSARAPRRLDPGTVVRAKDRDNFGRVVEDHGRTASVYFVSPDGNSATVDLPKSKLVDIDGAPVDPEATGFTLKVIDSQEFASAQYEQRYLVRNALVANQPAILGGPHKVLKTSQAVDLAISLGTATPFLGAFEVPSAVRVGLLSGESGAYVLKETAQRVCLSRGRLLSSANVLWGFQLPQVAKPDHLDALRELIQMEGVEVVIIDPAFLCLLSGDTQGRQASNVFDMGSLLMGLGDVGQETGCTIILLHHLRKNMIRPHDVPELEDLAFAGFAEWARQWILIGRREPYEPGSGRHNLWLNVGGSAGHSGTWAVDIDEGVPDENFHGRKWHVEVCSSTSAREDAKQRQQEEKTREREDRSQQNAQKILDLMDGKGPMTAKAIRDTSGLNNTNFQSAFALVLQWGAVTTSDQKGKNGRTYEAYEYTAGQAGQAQRDRLSLFPSSSNGTRGL